MLLLRRLFGKAEPDPREALRPLYAQIVARARQPHWYEQGGVPDSVTGRFEMISAIMTMVLLRLEPHRDEAKAIVFLVENFSADVEAQLRELGVGDMVVGKRTGKLMGAFAGRLGAYREALANDAAPALLGEALARNLYGDSVPSDAQIVHVAQELREIVSRLAAVDMTELVAGKAAW